jgi:hypothetical protein
VAYPAGVAESADAGDLKSPGLHGLVGSTPTARTIAGSAAFQRGGGGSWRAEHAGVAAGILFRHATSARWRAIGGLRKPSADLDRGAAGCSLHSVLISWLRDVSLRRAR